MPTAHEKALLRSAFCAKNNLFLFVMTDEIERLGAPVPQDNARRGRYSLSKESSALKNYYNALPYELVFAGHPGSKGTE